MATTLHQANRAFMLKEYAKHLESCRQTAKFLTQEMRRIERGYCNNFEAHEAETRAYFKTTQTHFRDTDTPEHNDV